MKYIKSKFRYRAVFSDKGGQSLMEVVVALGVVLFVLISIVALVLINSFGQKGSENRTIALNLAREGIEVFRNMRDTARLQKISVVLTGFTAINHYFYPKLTVGSTNSWSLVTIPSNFNEAETRLRLKDNLYQHVLASTEKYTPFQRQLIIDPICAINTECIDGVDDVATLQPTDITACTNIIGYRVKSQLKWLENNQTVNLELVDFLYDWR